MGDGTPTIVCVICRWYPTLKLQLPCDDDNPSREGRNRQSRDDTNELIPSLISLTMVMVIMPSTVVVCTVVGSVRVWQCWEECRRSGEDHDPCQEGDGYQASPDTTVVLQDDAGQDLE